MSELYPADYGTLNSDDLAQRVSDLWSAGVPLTQLEAEILIDSYPEIPLNLGFDRGNNAA
jgi:hypothetical protein